MWSGRSGITTYLMHACQSAQKPLVEVLLQHKAKVNAVDENGWTALMHAAYRGHTACVALLLRHGAGAGRRATGGSWSGKSTLEIAEAGRTTACPVQLRTLLRENPQVQAVAGQADHGLAPGTRIKVKAHGKGTYERFEKKTVGANLHFIRFDGDAEPQPIKLKDLRPTQWSVLPPQNTPRLCRAWQLLMFARGAVQPAGTSHCGDMPYDVLTAVCALLSGMALPTRELAGRTHQELPSRLLRPEPALAPLAHRAAAARASPRWIPSAEFKGSCMLCAEAFSLLERPHHCRSCGWAVCGGCSAGTLVLRRWLEPDKPHAVRDEDSEPLRVCNLCLKHVRAAPAQVGGAAPSPTAPAAELVAQHDYELAARQAAASELAVTLAEEAAMDRELEATQRQIAALSEGVPVVGVRVITAGEALSEGVPVVTARALAW